MYVNTIVIGYTSWNEEHQIGIHDIEGKKKRRSKTYVFKWLWFCICCTCSQHEEPHIATSSGVEEVVSHKAAQNMEER